MIKHFLAGAREYFPGMGHRFGIRIKAGEKKGNGTERERGRGGEGEGGREREGG